LEIGFRDRLYSGVFGLFGDFEYAGVSFVRPLDRSETEVSKAVMV